MSNEMLLESLRLLTEHVIPEFKKGEEEKAKEAGKVRAAD